MECFVIIVNDWKPLTIIKKCSILDVAAVLDPPLSMVSSSEIYTLKTLDRFIFQILYWIYRGSLRRCSIKKDVLKSFPEITGKHLCWNILFNKVARLRLQLKKSLGHRCFLVNFIYKKKFIAHLRWLFTDIKVTIGIFLGSLLLTLQFVFWQLN